MEHVRFVVSKNENRKENEQNDESKRNISQSSKKAFILFSKCQTISKKWNNIYLGDKTINFYAYFNIFEDIRLSDY